jgi:hypothetical protein
MKMRSEWFVLNRFYISLDLVFNVKCRKVKYLIDDVLLDFPRMFLTELNAQGDDPVA